MANVNSLSGANSTSSISGYFSNAITGLASGMDTEAMIENSVAGYKTKIQTLQQQQEKLTWKQDAYRSITDKMVALSQKYTSYTSKTNLMSNAFFTNAVTTTTNGANADKVSATGKATSDIKINSVTSLAASARYAVDADALNLAGVKNTTGTAVNWDDSVEVSGIAGSSMTLRVGTNSIGLSFGESDKYDSLQDMADSINQKLENVTATSAKDGTVKAGKLVKATVNGDTLTFEYTGKDGDSPYISGVTGALATTFGVKASASTDRGRFSNNSFTIDGSLTETKSTGEYLAGKTVDVTLDGVTKSIKIGDVTDTDSLVSNLTEGVNKAFGIGRVTVSNEDGGLKFGVAANSGSTLTVTSDAGETLGIGKNGVSNYLNTGKTLGELLGSDYFSGLGDGQKLQTGVARSENEGTYDVKYFDSNGNQVDEDGYRVDDKGEYLYHFELNGVSVGAFSENTALESVLSAINNNSEAGVKVSYSNLTSQFVFTSRNTGATEEIKFGDGLATRLFGGSNDATNVKLGDIFSDDFFNEDGSANLYFGKNARYDLTSLSKASTVQDLMDALDNTKSSFQVSYDNGAFSFTNGASTANFYNTKDKTDASAVSMSYTQVFDATKTDYVGDTSAGTDAVLNVTVNGKTLDMVRSSNVVQMDGLSVTLKGTFDSAKDEDGNTITDAAKIDSQAVTFTTQADADTIVDAVKSFVDDYNTLMREIHDAYSTRPAEKSSSTHTKYEPLTDDDKASMSESAIKAYEEKAKQGLLFADSDLSSLYNRMRSLITSSGSDRISMESIGLKTTYSDGVTQIDLNEDRLREALDSNPDAVKNVFTKTKDNGAASNGLMTGVKSLFDAYASTSIVTPGILVNKAGTKLSSLSLLNNTVQSQIDNVGKQIETWQTKMSSKIDYYTRQFTALEQLMQQMNSQSSALSGLLGY